ncbi:tripartite tricarboxylate transporter TctB family protein [Ramlibacter sp.]|uniref:tripartite tricarboxylate transporter TctB family protein n=1 Tax=Ramlibacter sp. TaxID=1917967 RepID=UPI002D00F282|nr:tripartite tricarboxylate transporter TctB family protein [Ramlibacter sp.]HWI82643.1 tripartite tricarboxylate transporter TctB family protein [Ramlibacter sp.]
MRLAIRNQKNFVSGLLYIACGLGFAAGATNYNLGTSARMGPGYFPFWLGLLLACIGAIVLAAALRPHAPPERLPKLDLKTLGWVLGSVALFALLLAPLGLALALVALVLVSSMASHEFGWKGAVLNAALLLALCMGAFVYGLGLQLPLWPSFIG